MQSVSLGMHSERVWLYAAHLEDDYLFVNMQSSKQHHLRQLDLFVFVDPSMTVKYQDILNVPLTHHSFSDGLSKPNIAILSDEFLEEGKGWNRKTWLLSC